MAVPFGSHPVWSQLVSGQKHLEFDSLAVKVALGRLRLEIARKSVSVAQAAAQLHDVFSSNATLPSVQKDLLKLPV
jgi:hypothetical protein